MKLYICQSSVAVPTKKDLLAGWWKIKETVNLDRNAYLPLSGITLH